MSKNDQNNSFKVESGIPLPLQQMRISPLPFHQMEIGDSILISGESVARIKAAAYNFGKYYNRRFTVRHIGNNEYRCWRVS